MNRAQSNRFIVLLLIVILASFGLFASASSEKQKDLSLSSMDLTKVSLSQIKQAYEHDKKAYESEYLNLQKALDKARRTHNAEQYYQEVAQWRNLSDYSLTQEETQTLISRLVNLQGQERDDWATWLYQNSGYYRPSLNLSLFNEGQNSRYSFHQGISVQPGEMVTLPSVTLGGDNGVFVGWGISPDEVKYKAGQQIPMPYTDQTLYAIFNKGVKFSDEVTDFELFSQDVTVAVPSLTAPDSSYLFDGWYDNATGTKLEGSKFSLAEGKSSASFSAYWKSLKFSSVGTQYYKDNTVPSDEQASLLFTLGNSGNEPLHDCTLTLESDNPGLKVLSGSLSSRRIDPGEEQKGEFTILLAGASGSTIEARLKVVDSSGASWSQPVIFTVK
ncbi:MAG: hypothetical protein WCR02_03120 [Sphaerochaetaceae bacterium]